MKKRWKTVICTVMIIFGLTACGNTTETNSASDTKNQAEDEVNRTSENAETVTEEKNKILVAYFTRLPNTESGDNLDTVIQGEGPYGAIGEKFEGADLDAISSASITVTDGEAKGNVEAVAEWISEYTKGDLFSIETVEKYPVDYDAVIEQGGQEQRNNDRPELRTHVEDMENYSIIYLGFPNWYNDMPMAVYSFLEEYNLEGKTIVPFVTSAGSGLANTRKAIVQIQPGAEVVEDGLALRMEEVDNSEERVKEWIDSLSLTPSQNNDTDDMTVGTYPDGSSPAFSDVRLKLIVDEQEIIVRMYDNTAVDAFLDRLPLDNLEFFDLSGIEKPIGQPDDPFSIEDETPGYDPVTGEMVIYRPWGNFTFFYGDFRYSDELVPLGKIESGLDILAGKTEDFTGTLEIMEQ